MPLTSEAILLIGMIAVLATVGILYIFACSVRDAVEVHDLRVRAIALRNERIAYLREQSEADTIVTQISLPGVNAASASQEPAMTGKPAAAGPAKKKH